MPSKPSFKWVQLLMVFSILLCSCEPQQPLPSIKACGGSSPCYLTRKGLGSEAEAAAYYTAIDTSATKGTLSGWQSANGFVNGVGDVRAIYFNGPDLQLGRDMNCKQQQIGATARILACYVSNFAAPVVSGSLNPDFASPGFPNADEALADAVAYAKGNLAKHPFATVAMESIVINLVVPVPFSSSQVNFYVFDSTGARITKAALDSEGAKAIPQMCMACHGGSYSALGQTQKVTGASFLPFDVFNFRYSQEAGYRRQDQEEAFRQLNALVLDTNPTIAIQELIYEWYPGISLPGPVPLRAHGVYTPGKVASDASVPQGWVGHENIYRNFVVPYCRSCHVASAVYDFRSYQQFKDLAALMRNDVCRTFQMPHAEVPFRKMWTPAGGIFVSAMVLDDPAVLPVDPSFGKCVQ